MAIRASGSSPAEAMFFRSTPHLMQRCTILYFAGPPSRATGSIEPPHGSARSPGFTSTCLLHRHVGQWFVYPSPFTCFPQCSHVKFSNVRLKLICVPQPASLEAQRAFQWGVHTRNFQGDAEIAEYSWGDVT